VTEYLTVFMIKGSVFKRTVKSLFWWISVRFIDSIAIAVAIS